ncbi:MAG: hypothetical protein MK008_02665 [Bdellovibrionales bacterium]|nr:hypothetical protein [Bdellovibrionales bacterium]
MKFLFFLPLMLIMGCAQKDNQEGTNANKAPWSIEEPQIANKKGKIFLTNVQHQGKEPLQLTDSLIFDTNESTHNMTFTTLTRCYDTDQKELIETKEFSFQPKINIQKLMPKEALHPKYIIQKQTLNCTFKFTVQKDNGSSHNFRLYSQSVDVSEQVEEGLITIAGESTNEIKVIHKEALNDEHFIIPDLEVGNLELICQSFRTKYLAQKNLLNPFFGFNVKSIKEEVYPRELCRIIGQKNGDYLLSKPFQIEFKKLNISLQIKALPYKYNYQNANVAVADIVVQNNNHNSIKTKIHFPNNIMINKIGTNYSSALNISYQNTQNIEKINGRVYKVSLNAGEVVSFRAITNLTRKCFSRISLGLGSSVINDFSADVYFPPESITFTHEWHPEFYYKDSIKNKNYLSVRVNNSEIIHPLSSQMKGEKVENKVNHQYTPHNTNGCLNTPPRVHTPSGNISPF